jgi:hypothetical protein
MGLSLVQAGDMALKMTMSSDMGAMADSGCQGCPSNGDGDGKPTPCLPLCIPASAALLPDGFVPAVAPRSRASAERYPLLTGRTSLPDPYPPRPIDLV